MSPQTFSVRSFVHFIVGTSVILTLIPSASAGATSARLYLLAADTGHLYYSVDAADPEAALASIHRQCPGRISGMPNGSEPCLSSSLPVGGSYIHTLFWMPGSRFEAPMEWSIARPVRFHLELDVVTPVPHTVHLVLQKGLDQVESPAATETSPGVWEGTLGNGSPLFAGQTVDLVSVRVRTPAPQIELTMKTAGASHLEAPSPISAKGVPELLADHTYHPTPGSFATEQRSFWFNDDAWEAASYEGDLTETRRFDMQIPRAAEMVIAWVEAFETPFVHDVLRGREPDERKLTTSPIVTLFHDDLELDGGGNNGASGRGEDAVAATSLAAGTVTLEVAAPATGEHDHPYTAHILAVYGPRTLERMRWSFQIDHEGNTPAYRALQAGFCPGGYEPVPMTDAGTTFSADLDWDTESLPDPGFTVRFSLPTVGGYGCGEAGTGDRLRITVPGERVWFLGATPAPGRTFAGWRDTVFEMDVRYAYTAPPAS